MPEGIVPWVRAADPAAHLLSGFQAGAQVAQAQASLAAQRNLIEQRTEEAHQRLEVQRAYQQQMADLRQGQLANVRKALEQKALEAARSYEAKQTYQQRVSAGEDPMDVLMELGPLMGQQQTAEAAVIRAQMQHEKNIRPPQMFDLGAGVSGVWNPQSGAFQLTQKTPKMTENQRLFHIQRAEKQLDTLTTSNPDLAQETEGEKWSERRKAAWKAGRARISNLQSFIDRMEREEAGEGKPSPGEVMDGYRFIGGNPADQANWEKVAPVAEPAAVGDQEER